MKTQKFFLLREDIKKLAEEQRSLRPQRKSSYEGERTVKADSWHRAHERAAMQMQANRRTLRHLLIAYGLLRGLPYTQIEQGVGEHNQPDWTIVDSIKKKHEVTL